MTFKEKLEKRYGIKGYFQITIIFVVFGITGSSSLKLGNMLMDQIGASDSIWYIKYPVRIVLVFFMYQILLITVGSIFGQFKFFWAFEKKMWGRILGKKSTEVTN